MIVSAGARHEDVDSRARAVARSLSRTPDESLVEGLLAGA